MGLGLGFGGVRPGSGPEMSPKWSPIREGHRRCTTLGFVRCMCCELTCLKGQQVRSDGRALALECETLMAFMEWSLHGRNTSLRGPPLDRIASRAATGLCSSRPLLTLTLSGTVPITIDPNRNPQQHCDHLHYQCSLLLRHSPDSSS